MDDSPGAAASPFAPAPRVDAVVYRPAARGWRVVAFSLLQIAVCFWVATSSSVWTDGLPTPREIARHQVDNNTPLIWLAFAFGIFLLALLPFVVWDLLMFRVVADPNGLRWRRFLQWHSARWDEVRD